MNSGTTCTEIAVADPPGAPHTRNHLRSLGLLAGQRSAGAPRHCGDSHLATILLTCPRVLTSRPHARIEHQESGYAARRALAVSVLPHRDDHGLVRCREASRVSYPPAPYTRGRVTSGSERPQLWVLVAHLALPAAYIAPLRWCLSPAELSLVPSAATASLSALR